MNHDGPIAIFDSGIGGLSVLREVRARLPGDDLLYFADSAFAPYGGLPVEQIRERCVWISEFLLAQGAKALLVACNTATAVAIEDLRARFDLPIIGMEPALKPAANLSRSEKIAILATQATLGSGRYADLKDKHGRQVAVVERACHHWVEMVEAGNLSGPVVERRVEADLAGLIEQGVDTLVLGCTHFPFLAPVIARVVGDAVHLIDPAPAVVRQLMRRLVEANLCARGRETGTVRAWSSGDQGELRQRWLQLLGEDQVDFAALASRDLRIKS